MVEHVVRKQEPFVLSVSYNIDSARYSNQEVGSQQVFLVRAYKSIYYIQSATGK